MAHVRKSCQKYVTNLCSRVRLQHSSAAAVNINAVPDHGEKKGCSGTNTIIINGVPPSVEEMHQGVIVDKIRETILSTKPQTTNATINPNKAYNIVDFKRRMTGDVLKNLMKTLWASDHARNSGLHDTTISSRQEMPLQWGNLKKKLSNKNEHLISGKTLLPTFAENGILDALQKEEIAWENIISNSIDLLNLPQGQVSTGDESSFPCPQKILSMSNFLPRVKTNQGLFYSFMHALTYALQNGGEIGQDLKEPVPMQFATFNGTSFYFVWYQLNTLNTKVNKTDIKNIAWVNEMKLCDKIVAKIPDTERSVVYSGEHIAMVNNSQDNYAEDVTMQGFNETTAEMFANFLFYPVSSQQ